MKRGRFIQRFSSSSNRHQLVWDKKRRRRHCRLRGNLKNISHKGTKKRRRDDYSRISKILKIKKIMVQTREIPACAGMTAKVFGFGLFVFGFMLKKKSRDLFVDKTRLRCYRLSHSLI